MCKLGDRVEKFNPWTDDFSPILWAVKIQLLFSAFDDLRLSEPKALIKNVYNILNIKL